VAKRGQHGEQRLGRGGTRRRHFDKDGPRRACRTCIGERERTPRARLVRNLAIAFGCVPHPSASSAARAQPRERLRLRAASFGLERGSCATGLMPLAAGHIHRPRARLVRDLAGWPHDGGGPRRAELAHGGDGLCETPRRAELPHSLWAAPGPTSPYDEGLTPPRCRGNAGVKSGPRRTATSGQDAAKHLGSNAPTAPSGAWRSESSGGSARQGALEVEAEQFDAGYRDACDRSFSPLTTGIVWDATALVMSAVQQETGRHDVRNQHGLQKWRPSQPCRSLRSLSRFYDLDNGRKITAIVYGNVTGCFDEVFVISIAVTPAMACWDV
jgi:hypothetical protein